MKGDAVRDGRHLMNGTRWMAVRELGEDAPDRWVIGLRFSPSTETAPTETQWTLNPAAAIGQIPQG